MKRVLQLIFGLLLAASLVLAGFLVLSYQTPLGEFPRDGVFVEIPRGATVRAASRLLAEEGVVRSALAFEIAARMDGRPLQAGEYHFERPERAGSVLSKVANGKVYERPFAVPEGLTMFQIADRVAEAGFGTREEFLEAARDGSLIRDMVPGARNLEGFLFPATYTFSRQAPAQQVAEKMVAKFRAEWDEISNMRRPGAVPLTLSVAELVTMASLVERETPQADERPLVAAVFYNRLRKRIALQCDPTVLYAMELAGKNDGVINQSDLRLKSPYNTYLNRGLPPGPIGNPGRASLVAARHPDAVDYLYFVADGRGGHVFSKTLAEHGRSVARYRRMVAQQPRGGSGARANGARGTP